MTTEADAIVLRFEDDLAQINPEFELDATRTYTPAEIEKYLVNEAHVLTGQTPDGHPITYQFSHDGTTLTRDQTLGSQGIDASTTLRIHNKNVQG